MIVMVRLPRLERELTLIFIIDVPEPGTGTELGVKVTVWPLPNPEADKEIAELNPPETVVVMVEVPELPLTTVTVVGDALMVKLGDVPVTVSETVVVATVPPEVPVTVIR
jgi:hypothetical protein